MEEQKAGAEEEEDLEWENLAEWAREEMEDSVSCGSLDPELLLLPKIILDITNPLILNQQHERGNKRGPGAVIRDRSHETHDMKILLQVLQGKLLGPGQGDLPHNA